MDITAIDPYYDAGTATLNTANRNMTGQGGTQWLANVVPGDQVYGADGRMGGIVETVGSNKRVDRAVDARDRVLDGSVQPDDADPHRRD